MLITIGSLPGGGSSSIAKMLAEKIGYEHKDAGEIWDGMVQKRNTSVLELNLAAEKDPQIDAELDQKMLALARKGGNIILESRLVGYFCAQERIKAFKIWLEAPHEIREIRLAKARRQHEKVKEREESEKKRYSKLYHIDIDDLKVYDLVVNTAMKSPPEILEIVLKAFREAQNI